MAQTCIKNEPPRRRTNGGGNQSVRLSYRPDPPAVKPRKQIERDAAQFVDDAVRAERRLAAVAWLSPCRLASAIRKHGLTPERFASAECAGIVEYVVLAVESGREHETNVAACFAWLRASGIAVTDSEIELLDRIIHERGQRADDVARDIPGLIRMVKQFADRRDEALTHWQAYQRLTAGNSIDTPTNRKARSYRPRARRAVYV